MLHSGGNFVLVRQSIKTTTAKKPQRNTSDAMKYNNIQEGKQQPEGWRSKQACGLGWAGRF